MTRIIKQQRSLHERASLLLTDILIHKELLDETNNDWYRDELNKLLEQYAEVMHQLVEEPISNAFALCDITINENGKVIV